MLIDGVARLIKDQYADDTPACRPGGYHPPLFPEHQKAQPMDSALRRTALWATTIQGLFALTWALYVAFLPGLLARAGLEAGLAIFFVLLDQAVFALADWASGIYADRLVRVLKRIGPALTACALASSGALLALPWVASLGVPALLIAVTILWTATSSALRAPVFTLLGRVGGEARPAGAVSLALFGIGIAGAIAPLLTKALAQSDPRLALGVCAIALAVAALFASRLEASGVKATEKKDGRRTLAPAFFIAVLVAVAGFGVQVHTVLLGARVAKEGLAWAAWWAPAFWMGFALGLVIAALIGRAARTAPPLRSGGGGLLLGALALVGAQIAADAAMFALAQLVAGAAWAVFTAVAVRAAMNYGSGGGIGSPIGLIFSALAIGALMRVGLTVAGLQSGPWIAWLPAAAYAVSGGVLLLFALGGARPAHGVRPVHD
jgi:hypothetical protein